MRKPWAHLRIGQRRYLARSVGHEGRHIWEIGEAQDGAPPLQVDRAIEQQLAKAIKAAVDLVAEGNAWRDHLADHGFTIERAEGGFKIEHDTGVELISETGRLFRDGRSFAAVVEMSLT